MGHLGPDRVRREFKGIVERCADMGFDLAGGPVPVVPTAHHMMGGVVFRPDGGTALPGLFAAGEDTGGVHGANRLGGNGVANSTVFGGIAGDSMAAWVPREGTIEEPCPAALNAALAQLHAPFGRAVAPASPIRDALHARCGRRRASCAARPVSAKRRRGLDDLDASLDATGVDGRAPAFNLARHDWLNLKSLILVSRTIIAAASARAESCGAHWREDAPRTAPETDSLASPVTTLGPDGRIDLSWQPIAFTRVQPGQSLLPAE